MTGRPKIIVVGGARPNFVKIAPLMHAFAEDGFAEVLLVHTGQHSEEAMSGIFFEQLGIPRPKINLSVGLGNPGVQTGAIMAAFEPVAMAESPTAVVVVGDVNSTVACGLVAAKIGILLAHIEAGLRSFDRSMPEEINRVVVDAISDLLFCSEPSGVANLRREGIPEDRIFLVGNVMIDTLLAHREKARSSDVLRRLGLEAGRFVTLTLHRPSNVDDTTTFLRILDAVDSIQRESPVIFPVHPRTRRRLEEIGVLATRVKGMENLIVSAPLAYLDFLHLMASSKAVLTDSGGIQEETTILKVPCLTLRENTERPITVEMGTNRVVGTDPSRIVSAYHEAISHGTPAVVRMPPLWDGMAARRIVHILKKRLE
ncbi:MAG: UDP-N-acetylglucosamine 2-epimerase (non-hydrolyzing) [Kiritimatiellae bacterium]|nr:UDP-N-acetylglucosamine 2-epimerase (non-hydrolyzing) [Kiritimatiellia bacterium]